MNAKMILGASWAQVLSCHPSWTSTYLLSDSRLHVLSWVIFLQGYGWRCGIWLRWLQMPAMSFGRSWSWVLKIQVHHCGPNYCMFQGGKFSFWVFVDTACAPSCWKAGACLTRRSKDSLPQKHSLDGTRLGESIALRDVGGRGGGMGGTDYWYAVSLSRKWRGRTLRSHTWCDTCAKNHWFDETLNASSVPLLLRCLQLEVMCWRLKKSLFWKDVPWWHTKTSSAVQNRETIVVRSFTFGD